MAKAMISLVLVLVRPNAMVWDALICISEIVGGIGDARNYVITISYIGDT